MRPWCSWLTQPPVTGQTAGSSPVGRAGETKGRLRRWPFAHRGAKDRSARMVPFVNMPKRGRGGLEGNMPGVSQAQRLGDKSSDVKLSARKMESETQKHIDALLFRLKEVARWTPPGRASL